MYPDEVCSKEEEKEMKARRKQELKDLETAYAALEPISCLWLEGVEHDSMARIMGAIALKIKQHEQSE